MRYSPIFAVLVAATTFVLITVPTIFASAIGGALRTVWDVLAPAFNEFWPDLDRDQNGLAAITGDPLDPALIQSLRHDAGMRRMAAARNV